MMFYNGERMIYLADRVMILGCTNGELDEDQSPAWEDACP